MKNSHIYANLPADQMEELFSNFIIDSWSYSKVSTFARNEKVFEMQYIYRQRGKSSSTTIAGQAYHAALQSFFLAKREGSSLDLVGLEQIAFGFINETPANYWKLQKTTPTIDNCIEKATKTVSALLNNFLSEISTYSETLKNVIDVECKFSEFVKINGVDIPIPCHAVIDLVIETIDGKTIIIDHKSKASFTDDKDIKLTVGKQAITYATVYEARTGVYPDEVWFVENKYSKNRDGSPQLQCFKIVLDNDTRKLYEALLYEPLKRMIEAISDPDYVYVINDNDNFIDRAELFDFWCQTMIAEVDDFNIPENKKEMVENRMRKIRDSSIQNVSPTIIKNFKKNASSFIDYDLNGKDMTNSEKIEHVLRSFGKLVEVSHEFNGYSSNTYLLNVSAGININSIYKHRLDLANALNVSNVRIGSDLLVYGGKSYVALEAGKKCDKTLLWDEKYIEGKKIPLGMDNFGNVVYWDLNNHSTPHMLVGGSTGSGKTVFLVSTVEYAKMMGYEKIVIFDPKCIDFEQYKSDPMIEVYNDIEDIEFQMGFLVEEMKELVSSRGFRKTLIIFDEWADSVQTSRKPKQLGEGEKTLEENLQLLLQKSRALGFNIIAATQRASVKVINGDAKVNFPIQVCFRVNKEVDSKVMIDEAGAESLMGYGDGLIKSPEYLNTIRFQGFFKK
jgi:hypothetical protein